MTKRPIVFDACALINLLIIDDGDLLLNAVNRLSAIEGEEKICVSETVMHEIRVNLGKRKDNKEEYTEIIRKISLRVKVYYDINLVNHFPKDYIHEIKDFLGYKKKDNGELFSTALSLLLSRKERHHVIFYTDDFPAKEDFTYYFNYQQIGYIADTVDLLIFLYWHDDSISYNTLKQKLNNLRSCYLTDFKEIKEVLSTSVNKLTGKKNLKIRSYLSYVNDTIYKPISFDTPELQTALSQIRKVYPKLSEQLLAFFTNQCKMVNKINSILANIDNHHIYNYSDHAL